MCNTQAGADHPATAWIDHVRQPAHHRIDRRVGGRVVERRARRHEPVHRRSEDEVERDLAVDVGAQFAARNSTRPDRAFPRRAGTASGGRAVRPPRSGRIGPARPALRTPGRCRCRRTSSRREGRSRSRGLPSRCRGPRIRPASPTETRPRRPHTCCATTCRWWPCWRRCDRRSVRWSSRSSRPRASSRTSPVSTATLDCSLRGRPSGLPERGFASSPLGIAHLRRDEDSNVVPSIPQLGRRPARKATISRAVRGLRVACPYPVPSPVPVKVSNSCSETLRSLTCA